MEIVVASSNNGAVENVTTQIPGAEGIGGQWRAAAEQVAVTRARRRLYVIGDRSTWGTASYFDVLARHMRTWPARSPDK